MIAVGSLALVACGGGSDSAADGSGDTAPDATTAVDDTADGAAPEQPANAAPTTASTGHVDLVGPDVVPEAEIDTNLLPSVVVDDVTSGRKVNFRNLVPQEKPILLWMYAPH